MKTKPYCCCKIHKDTLLYIDQELTVIYANGLIVLRYTLSGKIAFQLKLPDAGMLLSKSKLIGRLLRSAPRFSYRIDKDTFLISSNGYMYALSISSQELRIEQCYERGMKNPLSLCIPPVSDYSALFGEYIWNVEKGPCGIYGRVREKWTKVYEFPPKTVTHIHGIKYDVYRNRFLIFTGDTNDESGLWDADLGFHEVKRIVSGEQKFRMCAVFPTPEGIIYATDSPQEKNGIYFIGKAASRKPVLLYALPGPCIFSTEITDTKGNKQFVFATTVEPDSDLPSWRLRTTMRRGKGILDNKSHLIIGNRELGFRDRLAIKKDILPMWLFQFGNFKLPEQKIVGRVFAVGQSLSGIDQKTVEITV